VLLTVHDVPVRVASFTLEERFFLWSRVRLYADRAELVGWSFSGRYHRVVPLGTIEEAKAPGDDLVLVLAGQRSLRIGIDAPERWAAAIATHRDVRGRDTPE
jgi:hypothetical protein